MALVPRRTHWWLAATRGFTTGPMPCGGARRAEIELDPAARGSTR